MIAFRFTAYNGVLNVALEHPHVVTFDGDDFVARCGVRWSRSAAGGVLPNHYTGKLCKECLAAPPPGASP